MRFTDIEIGAGNNFAGKVDGARFSARFDLFIIRQALDRGCDFEGEADGFGPGMGTNGDWSGIRDSSGPAQDRMFEKAINFLFPE